MLTKGRWGLIRRLKSSTWFNNWSDDDSESKHDATFIIDNKLVVF